MQGFKCDPLSFDSSLNLKIWRYSKSVFGVIEVTNLSVHVGTTSLLFFFYVYIYQIERYFHLHITIQWFCWFPQYWDDHPAIYSVGVVDANFEVVFQTLMSLGQSRSDTYHEFPVILYHSVFTTNVILREATSVHVLKVMYALVSVESPWQLTWMCLYLY
jgi:hypothetical protein